MTKYILSALTITIMGFINAQTQDSTSLDSDFKFGVKAGYSLSTMKFFDEKLDSKSYFYVGLVGEQPISSKFGIQAEILYTQIGGIEHLPVIDFTDTGVIETGRRLEFNYQLNQIQVPVSAKYYFIPDLSVSAGMNIAFNISEKVKTNEVVNGSTSHNYEGIKSVNLFPFLGAEYKISDKFFVDARYNFNFFEIHKGDFKTKVGFLQAGVGYRFK